MAYGIIFIACLGALLASAILTPMVIVVARRFGVVDLPNSRKVHSIPTPRLGGLAIAAAMFIAGGATLSYLGLASSPRLIVAGAAALSILVVGVVDDLFNVPSKFKLIALIAASSAICGAGVRIDTIALHGVPPVPLGPWVAWPLTMLWIISITVSINFIDGLDGLAAGIAAIACAVIAIAGFHEGESAIPLLAACLASSLCGFLFFNFNPAKIFMGDCGSMFLGFSLATLSLLQAPSVGTTTGLLLPALALSIPIMDTALTMVRRGIIHRGSVFQAERGHIHHRLLDLGLCQKHAVLVLYGGSVVAAGVGLVASLSHGWGTLAGLLLLIPVLLGLFRTAGSTRVRETIAAIRRNRAIGRETKRYAAAFEELQLRFRNVTDFDSWWLELCTAAERFDFSSVVLPLTCRSGQERTLRWHPEQAWADHAELVEVTVPIPQRRRGTKLRATVEVRIGNFLETAGQRIALFSRLMDDHSLLGLPESSRRIRRAGLPVKAPPRP